MARTCWPSSLRSKERIFWREVVESGNGLGVVVVLDGGSMGG